MQEMLDSDDQETMWKVLTGETYDSLTRLEMTNHLN